MREIGTLAAETNAVNYGTLGTDDMAFKVMAASAKEDRGFGYARQKRAYEK